MISNAKDLTNRINKSAKKLSIKKDNRIDISLEQKGKMKTHYIDDKHITYLLQKATAFIYDIKDKKEVYNFTAHSIRVGTCVSLHS